jgi:DNA-binding beta-propeller fold protein YncE
MRRRAAAQGAAAPAAQAAEPAEASRRSEVFFSLGNSVPSGRAGAKIWQLMLERKQVECEGEIVMRQISVPWVVLAVGISLGSVCLAGQASPGPYKVLKTAKVGGAGGFDYVYADADGRRLYIPRTGTPPRVTVFNLDTLESVGEIPGVSAHGAAVDPKSGHGFATSKPLVMWDTKTLATIKTIDVQGGPDGILFDPFNQRVYDFSHNAPNVTVINSTDGSVAGTIDLGGAPEQAVTDGNGHLYIDLEDKDSVAVVDAKTMTVTAKYDLTGRGDVPAGLALDGKNHVLFVACRTPAPGVMVMLDASSGKIITTLPLAGATDGAVFNPKTMEAFSSTGGDNGTLTIVKENSPTSFAVEQNLQTMSGAKTLTLDSKTGHVLLIGAEYTTPQAPATPPPAGGRGPARTMVADSFSVVVVGR